jgi:hypothetical protein
MREISIIKAKILKYLEFKGISNYKFYKETGITNGILSQANGISEENLLKFLSTYRDISPRWLLTGEGEMLCDAQHLTINNKEIHDNGTVIEGGNAVNSPISVSSGNCAQQIAALQQRIADKDALIASLQKQVANLEELIAMLRK